MGIIAIGLIFAIAFYIGVLNAKIEKLQDDIKWMKERIDRLHEEVLWE